MRYVGSREQIVLVPNKRRRVMGSSGEFLSPEELATYLGIPIGTVYRWRGHGEGPRGLKLGRHVRYRRGDVEAWLEARADQPSPAA